MEGTKQKPEVLFYILTIITTKGYNSIMTEDTHQQNKHNKTEMPIKLLNETPIKG